MSMSVSILLRLATWFSSKYKHIFFSYFMTWMVGFHEYYRCADPAEKDKEFFCIVVTT